MADRSGPKCNFLFFISLLIQSCRPRRSLPNYSMVRNRVRLACERDDLVYRLCKTSYLIYDLFGPGIGIGLIRKAFFFLLALGCPSSLQYSNCSRFHVTTTRLQIPVLEDEVSGCDYRQLRSLARIVWGVVPILHRGPHPHFLGDQGDGLQYPWT